MSDLVVTATEEHHQTAEGLHFVGGELLVLVARAHLTEYWGCNDEDGEYSDDSHYEEICAAEGLHCEVAGNPVLSLQTPDSTAFLPTETGGYLLRWIGADSAAGVLSVALQQPYQALGERTWTVPEGGVVLFAGTADRREMEPLVAQALADGKSHLPKGEPFLHIALPSGAYEIDQLEGREFRGKVRHPSGELESLMVQSFRLRRAGE